MEKIGSVVRQEKKRKCCKFKVHHRLNESKFKVRSGKTKTSGTIFKNRYGKVFFLKRTGLAEIPGTSPDSAG